MARRYVLIMPCRDEAAYLPTMIASVAAQTVPPAKWIVIDDGSTDDTPRLLQDAQNDLSYLEVVRRDNRGKRAVGPGVIEAFYVGLEHLDLDDYDYLCKIDGDLDLPPRYFQILMERMEANPRIGTCSGKPYFQDEQTGRMISEKCGDEMSVGMTKFYRTECFRQIGGFVRQVMWDGIDCHRCRMYDWIACSWDEPDLRFTHLRPMGSSQKGVLTGRMRHGFGQYFMGTGVAYMTASAAFRMTRPPLIVGGLASWWGYMSSMFRRLPRYDDRVFRGFLRRYQRQCLLRGKGRITQQMHKRIQEKTS
jgi:glycosyltransferase involved in cell wall biosynthesis